MSISYDLKWKDWIWSNDFKLWQQILKEFWGKNRVFNKKKNRRELETCKGAWSQFSNLSNIIKRTFNPCIDVSCVFRNHQILLFESPPKSSFVSLKKLGSLFAACDNLGKFSIPTETAYYACSCLWPQDVTAMTSRTINYWFTCIIHLPTDSPK